ncbi:MAG: ATP cone domain-containing protein [Candidatus Micrarchaeia archaeon]
MVEEIQDLVEESLMCLGLYDVAKAYILYRERHRQLREAKSEVSKGFYQPCLKTVSL